MGDREGRDRELAARESEEMIAAPGEETLWDADEHPLAPARGMFVASLLGAVFWAFAAFILVDSAPSTQPGSPRMVAGQIPVVAQALPRVPR